ncbi:MAG: ABC transporter permease [Gammaproteobacteria bacterium]|nr:ABC transporter permease [Gammaproteobacteria bacterium]
MYLDGSQLTHLDSIGIWWLEKLLSLCKTQHIHCQLKHFSPSHTELIELLIEKLRESHAAPPSPSTSWVTQLGQTTLSLIEESLGLISFVGKVTFVFFYLLRHPHQIQWRNFFNSVQKTGFDALPITGLLSFLIGIVLAYQMGIQLRNYGANIFVVDLMGLSVLREFAPMMTAIILAGRSGSAFAAQIGTMKLNQEVDALRTLGIRPIERLVMPKLFALSLTLPLLTVWADMLGILGGMVMAKSTLNINFVYFLHRFSQVVPFKWYFIGLIKAPVFAAIIANIGCYQGLCVESNADSVGAHTTKSVVQAIFMIITFDAFFSILLSWLKI